MAGKVLETAEEVLEMAGKVLETAVQPLHPVPEA